MKVESFLDRANLGTGVPGPRVLYHYTNWNAAESIIRSQRFRATAHNCTNDPAELTTADDVIVEAVRAAHAMAGGMAARVLGLFLETYQYSKIGASQRCYLTCFSQTRDDPQQWYEYGGRGSGVCLGLRLLNIPDPKIPELATQFMPVDYQSEWRSKVSEWLTAFVAAMSLAADVEKNWRLAMGALEVSAAAWALASKRSTWEREQEVRMIFLVREGVKVVPAEEIRTDGKVTRFITVPVTRLRRIPVEEIIVGPNQDAALG